MEELLAKRGIVVSYETIRQWCRKFGPEYARNLKRQLYQGMECGNGCLSYPDRRCVGFTRDSLS